MSPFDHPAAPSGRPYLIRSEAQYRRAVAAEHLHTLVSEACAYDEESARRLYFETRDFSLSAACNLYELEHHAPPLRLVTEGAGLLPAA
jgi:hypothetical protein